jgi:AcrR family transcriptional regulator
MISFHSDNNHNYEALVELAAKQGGPMSVAARPKRKSIVRELRREQIENAALKAVLKHGFPGSSLRVVAREAKVPLSFLHYYFRDKDDLMRRVAQRILDRAIERLEQARARERDPLRAVEAVLEDYLIHTTENPGAMLAFIEYWANCVRKGTADRFYTKVHFRYRKVIADVLREAHAEAPDRLALSLFAMMAGYATFYWSKPPDPAERVSVLEMARAMVERAVRKSRGVVRAT